MLTITIFFNDKGKMVPMATVSVMMIWFNMKFNKIFLFPGNIGKKVLLCKIKSTEKIIESLENVNTNTLYLCNKMEN